MNRHLNDEEITALVARLPGGEAAREHLETCVSCRREVMALRELLDRRRSEVLGEEPDWESQHRRIMESLDVPAAPVVPIRSWHPWRPVLAAAAGLVVAAGIWLQVQHRPPATPPAGSSVPIEQILADVDATLSDSSVPGFEALEDFVPAPEDLESIVSNVSNSAS